MRIILIEDDDQLGHALYEGLKEEYACDWFRNAEDGQSALQTINYDVMILDINLPHMSGLDLLKHLRSTHHAVPVLLLTARDAPSQRVEGLDAGADDYLIKPFDFDELLARIRALLRRKSTYQHAVITLHQLELNLANKTVFQNGKPKRLSPKEFDILRILAENAGRCLSKSQIEEKIYDWQDEFESNTIEVHVSSIRRKLGKDIIRTLRGIGYIMEQHP